MKKLITCIIIVIIYSTIYGGDLSRKGTDGAHHLLVPVGAKGIATGGAFLANLTGLESIYYNPAGLDLNNTTEAMFSQMTYIADIDVTYFAVSSRIGNIGSFALSFKTFDVGDIPVTTSELPDGTGIYYSPTLLTTTLTYSKEVTDRILIGVNLKLITEKVMNTSASGVGIDFGVQYRFNEELAIGAVLKNVGTNMEYTGEDLKTKTAVPGSDIGSIYGTYEIDTEPFQIPSYFEMSTVYSYFLNAQNYLSLGSSFTSNNSYEDLLSFGLEYGYSNTFFLRGGYNFMLENADEAVYGFTLGAGINYKIGEQVGFAFDYAFRDIKEFPNPNHVFTVKLYIL
jgi:hypothetical protein